MGYGYLSNRNIAQKDEHDENVNNYRSKQEIEECVVCVRLELYNSKFLYGPKAIRKKLRDYHVEPLPSESTISRILSRRCLTHCRTGYYEEDYE